MVPDSTFYRTKKTPIASIFTKCMPTPQHSMNTAKRLTTKSITLCEIRKRSDQTFCWKIRTARVEG